MTREQRIGGEGMKEQMSTPRLMYHARWSVRTAAVLTSCDLRILRSSYAASPHGRRPVVVRPCGRQGRLGMRRTNLTGKRISMSW